MPPCLSPDMAVNSNSGVDSLTENNKISIHRPIQLLINTFGQMLARLKELINENYQQTILLRDAELKLLSSKRGPLADPDRRMCQL